MTPRSEHTARRWSFGLERTAPEPYPHAVGRPCQGLTSVRRTYAKIAQILPRGRKLFTASPAGAAVLLAALLVSIGSGCGESQPTVAAPSAAVAPAPKIGVDRHIPLRAWWNVTTVSRSGDEVFDARLSPSNGAPVDQPRYVQMTGLGFAYVGSQGGHSYTGPGVDHPWDFANNEYQVSFKFTGDRLGLLVLSTGGRWRVLVNGSVVGGSASRSAGSSYAYHVLDVDFSGAGGARSRTITFQLARGAWLAGIGTDEASDSVSLPARSHLDRPSVYWLGDSYVLGSGARDQGFDDFVHVAAERAGASNVTVDALGGTGYRKSNPAAKFPDYLARARLNLRAGRATPDLIVVGGSINDDVYSEEQVRSAAAALFAYLARAVPKAKVAVVPFTYAYPVPPSVQHAIDGVLAAARSAPNVVGVLDLPARVLAQSANQPVARVSARLASTTVQYHPSPAAQQLYGEMIGEFLAEILRQHFANGR
jgi:lysophospholipase L1-like esterase